MRRIIGGSAAFLVATSTVFVLPVYASPLPAAEPVAPSIARVEMGSVQDPAPEAVVATDSQVVDAGEDTGVEAGAVVVDDDRGDLPSGSAVPGSSVTDEVATTGTEAAGVPALSVNQPDGPQFSAVGVTWAHDDAVVDVSVSVRVRGLDGEWGAWTELEPDDVGQIPDPGSGGEVRDGTAPYFTGEATGVQVVVQAADGSTPRDVRTELVDPGTSAADDALGAPQVRDRAHADLAMPAVYSRAQWGADESIRTWDPSYASTIRAATLHHTADRNDYTAGDVPVMLRAIYAYHAVSRGWGDIGYNVLVDRFGRAWEGRYGGLASTVVGAHAGGFNSGTFGVSMIGDYDAAATPPLMVEQVAQLIAWKLQLYGVDPRGQVTLTSGGGGTAKYAAGVQVTLPTIFGHRDVGNTSCPGRYGYAQLDNIRGRVADLMARNPRSTIASRYAGEPALRAALGAPVGAEQTRGSVTWQSYENGRVYSTLTGGVREVHGEIYRAYLAAGADAVLGLPVTDELPTPGGAGRYNHFQNGASIYWTPSTGAVVVAGQTRSEWARTGWEAGPLGFPMAGEAAMGGGYRQLFQGGTVFGSGATGAHEVHGEIAALMERAGGVAAVGFPTTGELPTPDGVGRYNHFANSTSIYWTPGRGPVLVTGDVRSEWARTGWETGPLGYPVSGERSVPGGVQQRFDTGTVYWSPGTGAHELHGNIAAEAGRAGGVAVLGFPTTGELVTPDGVGRYNHFANAASVYWTPATGAVAVTGAIRAEWARTGWETGPLGYPVSPATARGSGSQQVFQRGVVVVDSQGVVVR